MERRILSNLFTVDNLLSSSAVLCRVELKLASFRIPFQHSSSTAAVGLAVAAIACGRLLGPWPFKRHDTLFRLPLSLQHVFALVSLLVIATPYRCHRRRQSLPLHVRIVKTLPLHWKALAFAFASSPRLPLGLVSGHNFQFLKWTWQLSWWEVEDATQEEEKKKRVEFDTTLISIVRLWVEEVFILFLKIETRPCESTTQPSSETVH